MKSIRTHWFSYVLLGLLACAAVPAAVAQAAKPLLKHHQTIPAGKDCSSCHKMTYGEWKGGPHGANDVQCTVCHGDITQTVIATPALSTCETCHADKVAQLKTDPFMSGKKKTCVTCHPPHALKPHGTAAPASK